MSIEQALAELGDVVSREPFEYASSWPLDQLQVRRPDGSDLRLLVKQLGGGHAAKPGFVCDPAREIQVYWLLAGAGLGTARCYASGRWWLALERIDGDPLWQAAGLSAWAASARWAARLHQHFREREPTAPALVRHGRDFYRQWFKRAAAERDEVAVLEPALDAAIDRLAALTPTLIHGELYPANVLIADGRVTAVDWEMAAIGPGVIDLAALVTGWERDSRAAIVAAFGDVDPRDLAAAELVLALQWLGWSQPWKPPAAQQRDWLTEAQRAAGALR